MVAATKREPVAIANLGFLPEVDDGKFYEVTFQLGAARRWKQFCNGRWERDSSGDNSLLKIQGWKHVAAVHTDKCLQGAIVNGLIGEHNQFLRFNKDRGDKTKNGEINRMLAIIDIREVPAPAVKSGLPVGLEEVIARASAEAAVQAVAALVASGFTIGQSEPSGGKRSKPEKNGGQPQLPQAGE